MRLRRRRIGVYICHCGSNIAGTVDVKDVRAYAESLPNVIIARDYPYLCSEQGQELIKNDILDLKLDAVVVAACSPRMHEHTFRRAIRDAGMNPYCMEQANIREHSAPGFTQRGRLRRRKKLCVLQYFVLRCLSL